MILNEGFMVLRPDPPGLSAARGRIRDIIEGLRLSEDEAAGVLIAVGEAISNACLHGSMNPDCDLIRLSWRCSASDLVVIVRDNGRSFANGLRLCPSEHRGMLARGIELMRAGTDEVGFSFDDGAKVVLRKRVRLVA